MTAFNIQHSTFYKKTKKLFSVLCFMFSEKKGFTLLELLVVITIIALLSGVLWVNFATSIVKGRDSRRKQDLESISKALELYYHDNKAYPSTLPDWGESLIHTSDSRVVYMAKLPNDPSSSRSYCYESDETGSYYSLYANLENRNDPKIIIIPVTCEGSEYNYSISSTNVAP